jgi:hypothetical protein
MAKVHVRVYGRFDGAEAATVTIERSRGLFTVRPLRRRRLYTLPLSDVAEMVIWRVVKADMKAKRRKKS